MSTGESTNVVSDTGSDTKLEPLERAMGRDVAHFQPSGTRPLAPICMSSEATPWG